MSNSAPRDSSLRAADTGPIQDDRIQVAQLLSEAAAQGRLDLAEYESRLAKAYAARNYAELDQLSADLPGVTAARRGASKPAPSTVLLAIMSGFERRGRWNIPRKLTTFTLWGSGVVDLRYADFTSAEVNIHAYSIMGGQTILLPPEVNVAVHGTGVMGAFAHDVTGVGAPGAPQVTITGFSLWGSVGIKRKKRRDQNKQSPA